MLAHTAWLWIVALLGAGCSLREAAAHHEHQEKNQPAEDEARKAKVVATVAGSPITVGEVEEKIAASIQPSVYKERQKLDELLNSLIDQRLMENEALRRGYDKIPKVADGVKRVLFNLMQTKYIEQNLPMEAIPKEEIEKYYKDHIGNYVQPSLVRASHIQVADEAKARSLLEQAKAKGFDLRKFRELATANSEDEATKKRGGDLQYFSEEGKVWHSTETIPIELAKGAFSREVKLRGSLIVLDNKEEADKILKEVMGTKIDAAGFKKLVAQYSKDPTTKAKRGDTGWFGIEGKGDGGVQILPEKLAAAAFSFQTPGTVVPRTVEDGGKFYIFMVNEKQDPGSLYPEVIKTDRGFHVLWIVNRRPALHKSLEEVEHSIRQKLWQDKKTKVVDEFVESLKKKRNVKIFLENLDKVVIDLSGLPPSATKSQTPEKKGK